MKMPDRIAGVLLHATSLPGGDGLGKEAYAFVDFLRDAGISAWQMLPLGPTGPGNSPYTSRSAFACDPSFISLQGLAQIGLLPAQLSEEAEAAPLDAHRVEYEADRSRRAPHLRRAWEEFRSGGGEGILQSFATQNQWAPPYAKYAARRRISGRAWWEWGENDGLAQGLDDEMHFELFLQWCLDQQWKRLRAYANARGVSLYGDLPIFVDLDSADVWANRSQFKLEASNQPAVVTGVPPDAFSVTGQRWGNPHYNWPAMRADGYRWWEARMRRTFDLFDRTRIDHFRGFQAAWEIPAGCETALEGHWEPGPGAPFFHQMEAALGSLPIMVEDLGIITDEVRHLRDELGYPGMAVLQFAFLDDDRNPHLPHNHVQDEVVFTGTHDNDTAFGWYQHAPEWERDHARRYLSDSGAHMVDALIEAAYRSVACTTIIPMQDVLELGSEARMNTPGVPTGNWEWRFSWDQLKPGRTAWLHELARGTGRAPAQK
jgi:4-alpha-glucanotransferase